jgi:hypothetical protein
MKERSFVQRNKRVVLRELTDVVAFRKGGESGPAPAIGSTPDLTARGVPAAQVRAFELAGWVFRERPPSELPGGVPQAKVFLKEDGRLALGTNLLTVQFREEDVSEEQANVILQPYGCQVVQRLTFAPGLFQVTVTDQARGDAIEVANQLVASGLVEFAEPQLIEEMGPRSG